MEEWNAKHRQNIIKHTSSVLVVFFLFLIFIIHYSIITLVFEVQNESIVNWTLACWRVKWIQCCRYSCACKHTYCTWSNIVENETVENFNVNYRAQINWKKISFEWDIQQAHTKVGMCAISSKSSKPPECWSLLHDKLITTYVFFGNTNEHACAESIKMACVKLQCTFPSIINLLFCIRCTVAL